MALDDEPITRREFEARIAEVPPIDPTANVLQLVEAAMQRQDDLRAAESRHRDALASLRSDLGKELRTAEAKRIDALAQAETARIDALLSAQQQNVALAAARAELTASALAERLDASAKTLATTVETTAKTLAATVEATAKALADRIAPLEQARYEQAGVKEQRGESRQQSQWTFERVLTIVAIVAGFVYFALRNP